jgi:hypothetical protein
MKQTSGGRRVFGYYALWTLLTFAVLDSGRYGLAGQGPAGSSAELQRFRGFMVDPPGMPESMEYYHRLIDFSADWGFNALIFRLTDDQGVAMRFDSHPEFIAHKNALTTAQVRELVKHSQDRGVELIPEVESFGHSKCITGVKQYADLVDNDPTNPDKRDVGFNALIPSHPRVLRLMEDIYREVASIFASRYLHGGCDEVAWGASEYSRRALQTKSRAHVWAQYINSLNGFARKSGKEFIIWGDHPLNEDPEILGLLNKDIIIMDWEYLRTDPKVVEAAARKVLGAGMRVIGGPSLNHCKWGPRSGTDQLRNIDAYGKAYGGIDDPRNLGVIVTNWFPSRYLQNSIWDGIAYAGISLKEGSSIARKDAFKRFVEKHYGSAWNETWADIFHSYYDAAPDRRGCGPSWSWPKLPTPWYTKEGLLAVLNAGSTYSPPFTRILSQMTIVEPLLRRNYSDFRSFRLSAQYLEELFWRNTVLAQEMSSSDISKESAADLIRTIAERDRGLHDELTADWNHGRPADSPIKTQDIYGIPGEQLLYEFGLAAAFSSELAKDPDSFYQLLRQAKPQAGVAQETLIALSPDHEGKCQ